jgi:hypothetical protein
MPLTIEQLVWRVHRSPTRLVLAVTGGGSRAIAELLEVPGASRTVLEASVPYSEPALIQWLGARPEQSCSEPTARAMAMAAYLRACRYEGASGLFPERTVRTPFPLAGVACTASLATDRPKRGPHRAHVAIQTARMTASQSVELVKGRRSRAEEEAVVTCLVLNALARACGLDERLETGLLDDEPLGAAEAIAPAPWQDLLAGRVEAVQEKGVGTILGARNSSDPFFHTRVVFPGAFNPIHVGHRRMAEVAERRLGQPAEFEISILNVDKPPLDFLEIQRRCGQFSADQALWLTRAATFEEKSRVFPGATFVVGADTLRRIADPRYYGSDPAACQEAIEQIAARGCRFLVFGRQEAGRFVGLSDLDLPLALRALCEEVPAAEFREDTSSTEIRRGRA